MTAAEALASPFVARWLPHQPRFDARAYRLAKTLYAVPRGPREKADAGCIAGAFARGEICGEPCEPGSRFCVDHRP